MSGFRGTVAKTSQYGFQTDPPAGKVSAKTGEQYLNWSKNGNGCQAVQLSPGMFVQGEHEDGWVKSIEVLPLQREPGSSPASQVVRAYDTLRDRRILAEWAMDHAITIVGADHVATMDAADGWVLSLDVTQIADALIAYVDSRSEPSSASS